MKSNIQVSPIGHVRTTNSQHTIKLLDGFEEGLANISGFSHLQVVWYGHRQNLAEGHRALTIAQPYKAAPSILGVFATRSQFRPNPILLTTILVERIDMDKGIIYTPYIDAEDQTPVLDIKPYHQYERVAHCQIPSWCRHWPAYYEDAAQFDWDSEFNF